MITDGVLKRSEKNRNAWYRPRATVILYPSERKRVNKEELSVSKNNNYMKTTGLRNYILTTEIRN